MPPTGSGTSLSMSDSEVASSAIRESGKKCNDDPSATMFTILVATPPALALAMARLVVYLEIRLKGSIPGTRAAFAVSFLRPVVPPRRLPLVSAALCWFRRKAGLTLVFLSQVLVELEQRGDVTAPIAVVWCAPHRHDLTVKHHLLIQLPLLGRLGVMRLTLKPSMTSWCARAISSMSLSWLKRWRSARFATRAETFG